MNIPVFHDDQHGTAICVGAAIYNAVRLVEKELGEIRVVCSGAGAAALACLNMIVSLGVDPRNVLVCDRSGVVHDGREEEMDPYKAKWRRDTPHRSLAEAVAGADVFLGLSGPGVLKPEMVETMADKPIIMALANPTPEILPEDAKAVRPDAIIATGRSDYPNQVNNVLCFPFLFRGALDVGATTINEEMKVACVRAIADLTLQEPSDVVARAYGSDSALTFGPEFLIPKPFDPRLISQIAPAIAKAAMESGVATRPMDDLEAYAKRLEQFVYRTGFAMKPLFDRAKEAPVRLAYADGEEERVLRAVQIVVDDGLARPTLVGRRAVIEQRIERFGLRLELDRDVALVDPQNDPRYQDYWQDYHRLMERKGVTTEEAQYRLRTSNTVIAAMMVRRDDADAMICGLVGPYERHLVRVRDVIGLRPGVRDPSALEMVVMPKGTLFLADTHVSYDPNAEELAEMAILAADEVRRFGIEPRVALLAHSNFGQTEFPSAVKMRQATAMVRELAPDLEVDGEMKGDTALNESVRRRIFPNTTLSGNANLLILPDLDSANIAYNLVKEMGDGMSVGPILIGLARSAHIVTGAITVRGLVNMTAVAAAEAQDHAAGRMPAGPLARG